MRYAITIALLLTTTFAFAQTPASVTIKAAAKKQPAVTFNHEKHATLVKTCDTCHHTNKGVTKATAKTIKKCSSCHLDAKGKVPSMRDASLAKNPFHALCIKCHTEQKKGPAACKDCHKK